MKNRIIILGISLVASFGLSLTAMAQEAVINLLAGESVEVNCDGGGLAFTQLSETQAIAECEPPSDPQPTETVEPEPTDTPVPEPSDTPVSSMPLCEDHNPEVWHALISKDGSCHYDHEHGEDPNTPEMLTLFGPIGAGYGGQEISYPWQTFPCGAGCLDFPEAPDPADGVLENQKKHEGYRVYTGFDLPCKPDVDSLCVVAYRIEIHGMPGPGMLTRFHSFSTEAIGCRRDNLEVCGLFRTGGWMDYGKGFVVNHPDCPEENDVCPLELGDGATIDKYVDGIPKADKKRTQRYIDPAGDPFVEVLEDWYGHVRGGPDTPHRPIVPNRLTFFFLDGWGNINPVSHELEFFCEDGECPRNGSKLQVHQLGWTVRDRLEDPDEPGFVNINGYTDRYGNLVDGCTEVGLDCIPLVVSHMPVTDRRTRFEIKAGGKEEFDTSPAMQGSGPEWWIEFPN